MDRLLQNQIAQLEALGGTISIALLHKSVRTPNRWISAGLHGVEIGGDGLLTSCHGGGATVDEAIDELFTKLTTLPDDKYLIRNAMSDEREAFRFDRELGSWIRVKEALDHVG